jgi:hypothetical protein
VRPRGLAIAWIAVGVVFVILVLVELSNWRSLFTEQARAAAERQRLSSEIQLKQQQLISEMREHSALLQEMHWSSSGGDPSAFLSRLAELAKEKRMKIMAVGPLERQTTPQFNKSWHTVQVQGPFREIRELAARVEQEKGILEDVHLEATPTPAGSPANPAAGANEIQARFKLTVLELSAQAKAITERTLASQGSGGARLALSVPTSVAQGGTIARDPFTFVIAPVSTEAPAPASDEARLRFEVKGIVAFPGGFLAIVNNQIVKEGDTVSGYRVERITQSSVTVRQPGGGGPQTIDLPDLASAAPAAPKR